MERLARPGPAGFRALGPWRRELDAAGISSVADVLERGTCIRDLPDRANYRLALGDRLVHVKHAKRMGRGSLAAIARVANGTLLARSLGVPTAEEVLWGYDEKLGGVHGTRDLAPARPLDGLLRDGAIDEPAKRLVFDALARAVARLHDAGLCHRDLYLNHVYVDPGCAEPLVAIIDWDRIDRLGRAMGRRAVKDLAALRSSLPPGTIDALGRRRFLIAYLTYRRLPRDRRARRFTRRIRKKAERIRHHVPRTSVEWLVPPEKAGP